MTSLLLKYKNRNQIPVNLLKNSLKHALEEQWQRVQFTKVIKGIVPFLPLESLHIEQVSSISLVL